MAALFSSSQIQSPGRRPRSQLAGVAGVARPCLWCSPHPHAVSQSGGNRVSAALHTWLVPLPQPLTAA